MTLKEFAAKWGLPYVEDEMFNIRTGARVLTGYVLGKRVVKYNEEYHASFIERLSATDEVLALQYRDYTSASHKDFDPENKEEVKRIIPLVMGRCWVGVKS